MGDGIAEGLKFPVEVAQLRYPGLQLAVQGGYPFLRPFALGDVARVDYHPQVPELVKEAGADALEHPVLAVLAAEAELGGLGDAASAHRPGQRAADLGQVVGVGDVQRAHAGELLRRVAEDGGDRGADVLELPEVVDDHDEVDGVLDERAEVLLALGERDLSAAPLADLLLQERVGLLQLGGALLDPDLEVLARLVQGNFELDLLGDVAQNDEHSSRLAVGSLQQRERCFGGEDLAVLPLRERAVSRDYALGKQRLEDGGIPLEEIVGKDYGHALPQSLLLGEAEDALCALAPGLDDRVGPDEVDGVGGDFGDGEQGALAGVGLAPAAPGDLVDDHSQHDCRRVVEEQVGQEEGEALVARLHVDDVHQHDDGEADEVDHEYRPHQALERRRVIDARPGGLVGPRAARQYARKEIFPLCSHVLPPQRYNVCGAG